MYIQDCFSDDLKEEVLQALKTLGVKSTLKKLNSKLNLTSSSKKVFNTSLAFLDRQPVVLRHSGALVNIPAFVINACNHIRSDLAIEGIFRKAGSATRQKDLKARIDRGASFTPEDHVIDVANILKYFFRELPEPLIPYHLHEMLLKCLLAKGKEVETILMSCLLLPSEHMDCLTYLIEFLNEVTALKDFNKMSSTNLAIVFAPNIMPIKNSHSQVILNQNTTNHVKIVKILLDNACLLGSVPDFICEKLSLDVQNSARRRRNSGSLTRMFSGLKRMVGRVSSTSASADSHLNNRCVVPGTPSNSHPVVPVLSAKKRKVPDASTPFSLKKRREVLRCLPEESILPKSPMVPKNFSSRLAVADFKGGRKASPNSDIVLRSRERCSPRRNSNIDVGDNFYGDIGAECGSNSEVSKFVNFSRKHLLKEKSRKLNKSSSFPALTPEPSTKNDLTLSARLAISQENCYSQFMDEDFVQVPKREYEEIQSRISKIESTISAEFMLGGVPLSDSDGSQEDLRPESKVDKVQSQFQKTLRHTKRLSDASADNIAQHLSRELKIRHSTGSKVMRSPSQRKIGSIRRRSRERTPIKRDLSRHMSLNLHKTRGTQLYRSRSLQRGRPNSVTSGLQPIVLNQSSKLARSLSTNTNKKHDPAKNLHQPQSASIVKKSPIANVPRSSSVEVKNPKFVNQSEDSWKSAPNFLANSCLEMNAHLLNSDRRESIKQIRARNAGMVMEKAKLYNNIADHIVPGVPQRTQSVGNFVSCVKLNAIDGNSHFCQENGPDVVKSQPSNFESSHFSGKENINGSSEGIKAFMTTPSSSKTPITSYLHNKHRLKDLNSSERKRRHVISPLAHSNSERSTPHKTVITIGPLRRSPRLNELKK